MSTGGRVHRVLFCCEAVTLAHVARPIALGETLDPARFERILACDARYARFFPSRGWRHESLHSLSSAEFLNALAKGRPVYSLDTLRGYVREDMELIERTSPDVIVGDFRLSLSVSARLAGVPYVAISNAYWSPHGRHPYVIPSHPLVDVFGVGIADILFRLARPIAFALHSLPLNRLRTEHGLPALGWDLLTAYTDADVSLYADVPEIIPVQRLPANHRYIGPVSWSPGVAGPQGVEADAGQNRPLVYVTLGSSGRANVLPLVLAALAPLPWRVYASTAGAALPSSVPANAFLAEYLPGADMARQAALVVCNGGSPTTHQALLAGVPVLGIADNLDQFLNMRYLETFGAGRLLRRDRATVNSIRRAAEKMLASAAYVERARQAARIMASYDAPARFLAALEEVLADAPASD